MVLAWSFKDAVDLGLQLLAQDVVQYFLVWTNQALWA